MWNNMAKNLLAVVPDATINIPVNAIRDALNVDRGTARQLHNHLASMTPSAFEALRPAPRPPAVGAAASQAEEQAKAQFAKERAQGVDPLAAAKKTAAQKSPKAAAPAKTEAGGTTTVTQPVAPLVSLKTKAAKTTAQRDATQEKWDNRRQKRKLAAKRAARRATVKDRWLSRRMRKALAAPQPAAAAEAPAKVGAKGQAVLTAAEQRKKRKEMLAAPGERLKGVVATVGLAPEQQAEVNRKNEEARAVNRSDAAERERQRGWGRNVVDENEDTGTKNSLSERADENEERANLREEGVVDPEAAAARMDDPDGPVASNSMGLVELGEIFGKERAAGSARNRIGADLLNEVTNGRMTAQEASDKYGTQPRGVKPWVWEGIKIPDFAAFVRAFMARLPSTDEQAQAIIREATKPGAKTQYLLKLLDPDYKSELQAVVDDLSGKPTQATATQTAPAGAAVKAKFKAKTAALQEGKSGDLTLKSRATASRGNSTPFVEPYKQMSVTEALDLGKKLPGRNAGVFFELLRSGMLRFVPKDVRVIFLPRDAYMDVSGDTESNVSDGLFSAEKKLIFIRADMSPMDIVQTIYHEVTHAATAYGVAQNPALQAELDAMLAYLKTKMDPKTYGLTNKYELLSEAFSNPDFQEELANIPSAGLGRRQSFWQAFIDFILRALDLPSGPGMRSALHDVIFMGTDAMVVNRKAEVAYNAPGARGTRLDIMPKASSTLADRVESTQRWFDGAGKADKAWAMSLGLRRLDQLVRDYATMFKNGGLKAFEIAEARISRAADDFKDRHAKAVEGGVEFLLSPEGRDKLAPLMVRATASQMHPDLAFDAPAHSHIEKNDGNRAIHRVLQQQYNELSPKAKNHYRSVRDYFQEARRDEVDAMLDSVLRTVAPDAKPADLARLRALIGAPRAIETLEKMDDAAVRALGFDNDALASREVLRHLAKVHALRNVPGPYFPLNRFGDYVVSYRNNDFTSEPMTREAAAQFVVSHGGAGLTVEAKGQAFVVRGTLRGTEFFENKSDAEARRDELRRRGYEPSEVESKRRMFALPELDALGLGVLERAVRNTGSKRGLTGSQVDTMIQAMRGFAVQYMPHGRTRMGSELQRENVAGASENMARVMGEHYNNASLRYGFLKEGGARDAAIESMRREVENSQGKRPGEQIKQMALLNELELRIRPGEMTGVEEFARKATKFGFFWALLSPSLPIVNTLQAAMNSQAVLGGRYGQAKAARAILNAQREAGYLTSARKGGGKMLEALSRRLERADFNLFDAVADQMMANTRDKAGTRALLDALKARNLVDHTMQMDLQDLGGGDTSTSKARRALDRVQNFTMMLPQIADVNNRTVIAKAAYDLARQAGKSQQAAVDEAIDQLMRSEPVYNASNKARIFTNKGVFGKLAAPLTQFNQGGQHLYDLLIVAGRDAFTSKDPKIRAEAQRVLTSLVVSHGVFSGVLGILAFQPLSFAIQAMALLAGNTEEPWDYEAAVRRYISTTVGPEMGEIVARGLPRAFGVDLSSRVSLGALNLPELRSYDSKGFSQMLGDFLLAPSGGRASQVIGGMSHLVNGNYLDGFRDISPRAVSDAIKAVQAASGERTDSRGRTEQTPDVGAAGVLLQAFGFRPSEMAERTEMRQSLNKETRQATSERRRILDAWVEADPATRIELRARIAEHNQAYPAFSIRSNNLTRAVDERRRQQREGRQVGGVYVPNNPAVAKWQRERASAYNMGEP
ncbi:MAG: PLxRFG domain-containing protein [Proteobacteria bacterium]|nr:PLxRFG domain-containing protein [Pseudomonadota bacterium]